MELYTLMVAASILLVALAVSLKHYYSVLREKPLPYPPGPKPVPLLGNLFDIPKSRPWVIYAEWRKLYGNLIHAHVPGSGHYLIVNSEKIAVELLEKRAKIYSDRLFTFIDELCGFDFDMGMLPYAERWRQNRKTFHQSFRPSAAIHFHPTQYQKVHDLLMNILDTPTDFLEHVSTLSSSLIFSGIYGLGGTSQDRPARIARNLLNAFGEVLTPGNFFLPKLFPFLCYFPSWMPGCQFKRFIDETRKTVNESRDVPFELALKRMDAGIPSLVGELVSKHQDDPDEIVRIKDMAATSYLAAADTTASAIQTFFLVMTLNPSVQAKAREEIDRAVGSDRLPNFDDRQSLPYVKAVYREVMRWNPPVPLGIPHRTSQNDIYDGYHLPQGALVITNIWGMTHDESIYDNPNEFRPERFLSGSPDAPFTSISNILAFGFGRRVCVGRYVADATVWLAIACALATLNITKVKDEHGNEIEVPGNISDSFFCHPEPFRCSIRARSAQAEKLIKGTGGRGEI